ncbi:hypothetical protein HAP48_0043060 [Bradyrhizobium septentrionale]|uniref:Uncharacterized protein n=1 Tax=Bradyrhizobium septentrionale TaxID=1404411 RepID=A0A973W3K5_9BRAD|nr:MULTISPECIES: hypothetical protein [Bradyrhizobium]MCK7669114.1 hypothetical protein [Bradyrhizobium sp. 2S1]UGY15239.1 hypothetical protein HAP48_0043060 [Bradyrhizobium septentrionale]UGY23822.1 hypothetical protein HU675_0038725 [Bradyrhizobium septentrionale]
MCRKVAPDEARKSTLTVRVTPNVSVDLRAEAKRRGVEYDEFAASILDAVANHGLYAAVLDI